LSLSQEGWAEARVTGNIPSLREARGVTRTVIFKAGKHSTFCTMMLQMNVLILRAGINPVGSTFKLPREKIMKQAEGLACSRQGGACIFQLRLSVLAGDFHLGKQNDYLPGRLLFI